MAPTSSNAHSAGHQKGASSGRKKKAAEKKAKNVASGPARKNGESDIKGKRRALLEQHLVDFPRVAVVKNGKRKLQREKGHWNSLHTKYWSAFPWRLPLDQEPPSDDEELKRLAVDPETPEEEEEKVRIMDKTTKKYQWWISRREAATAASTSVFSPWIDRLHHQVGPPPRRIADYQFYMQHPDHKLKILSELQKRHPVVTRDDRLKLLNRLAKEMLEDETQTVKDTIREEAEKEHAEALSEFQDSLEVTPEDMDEDDKIEAQEKFASVAIPLLDELENHTDFALGLFCCRVKETEDSQWGIEFKSIYSHNPPEGPAYCNFSRADPEGYREVVRIFSKFVWNMRAHQLEAAGKPGPPLHTPTAVASSSSSSSATGGRDTTAATSTNMPSTSVNVNGTPSSSLPSTAADVNETPANVNETPANVNETPANINETPANVNETPSTPAVNASTATATGSSSLLTSDSASSSAGEDIAAIVQAMHLEEAAATGSNPWKIRDPITIDAAGLKVVEVALAHLGQEFLDILPHVEKPRYKKTGAVADYPPALCLGDFWNPVGPLLRAWVCNPDLDSTRHGWSGTIQQKSPEGLAEYEESLKDPKGWQELRKRARRGKASTWGGANAAEGVKTGKRKQRSGEGDNDNDNDYVEDTAANDEDDAGKQRRAPKRKRKAATVGTETESDPVTVRPRPKPRRKGAARKGAAEAELTATDGSWAQVEREELTKKDWGAPWRTLVDKWWKKEEAMEFADAGGRRPPKVFTTKSRPEALAWWIGRGRNGTPDIKDANAFGKAVEAWWHAINPVWRRSDGEGPLKKSNEGPWVELQWPGPNGFLGVLSCLKWWAEKLEKPANSAKWVEIVEDVSWVLEAMPSLWPAGESTAGSASVATERDAGTQSEGGGQAASLEA